MKAMARNINNIDTTLGTIRQGSDSAKDKAYMKALAGARITAPSSSVLPGSAVSGLNAMGRRMTGTDLPSSLGKSKDGGEETTQKETEPVTYQTDALSLIDEFNNTIAPYVKMGDDEKRYYYNLVASSAKDGKDAVAIAEDYLTVHAIANATGLDRAYVRENEDLLSELILGTPAERTFAWGGSFINGWNQGRRQQELLQLKDEYRTLFEQGFDESSPEVQRKFEEIAQKEEEIEYNTDSSPHLWGVSAISEAIAQIPYMLEGALPSIAGGLIGAGIGGLVGAPTVGANVGSVIGRFLTYEGNFSGDAFYEMKRQGVPTDIALKGSAVDGIANGLNEAALDAVSGMLSSALTGGSFSATFFPSIFKRVAAKGTYKNFAGALGMYLLGQGTGELLQESSQSLTSSAILALTERAADLGYSKSVSEALSNALEEGIAGFTTGVILGIPGSIVATRDDVRKSIHLADAAKDTPSKQMFVNDPLNRATLKSFTIFGDNTTGSEVDTILGDLHDRMSQA